MNRLLGFAAAALVALVATGCATSSTTLVRGDQGAGQVIYRISEEKAFTIALEAYAVLLPKQSVDDIVDGLRRGYNADQRFALDWYSHRVLVIPAVGTDASGSEVHGYWFDISGSGTMPISGKMKSSEFLRMILASLEATGTATVVTNVRDGRYETDGRAYLGLKRDARDIKVGSRSLAQVALIGWVNSRPCATKDSLPERSTKRSVAKFLTECRGVGARIEG